MVAAHGVLVLVFRRLLAVLVPVDVEAVASAVGLGVHQVLVQLDASGTAESEVVSVAAYVNSKRGERVQRAEYVPSCQ